MGDRQKRGLRPQEGKEAGEGEWNARGRAVRMGERRGLQLPSCLAMGGHGKGRRGL